MVVPDELDQFAEELHQLGAVGSVMCHSVARICSGQPLGLLTGFTTGLSDDDIVRMFNLEGQRGVVATLFQCDLSRPDNVEVYQGHVQDMRRQLVVAFGPRPTAAFKRLGPSHWLVRVPVTTSLLGTRHVLLQAHLHTRLRDPLDVGQDRTRTYVDLDKLLWTVADHLGPSEFQQQFSALYQRYRVHFARALHITHGNAAVGLFKAIKWPNGEDDRADDDHDDRDHDGIPNARRAQSERKRRSTCVSGGGGGVSDGREADGSPSSRSRVEDDDES